VRADYWRAAANTSHSLHRSDLLMARFHERAINEFALEGPARTGPCLRGTGRTRDVSDFSTKSVYAAESDRIARAIYRKTWAHVVR
jgi:hypothetical protein